jgi:hypothetical protein
MALSSGLTQNTGLQGRTYALCNSGLFSTVPNALFESINSPGDYITIDDQVSSGMVDILLNVQGQPSTAAPASRISLMPGESYFGDYSSFVILPAHQEIAAGKVFYGYGRKKQNNIGKLATNLTTVIATGPNAPVYPRRDVGSMTVTAADSNAINFNTGFQIPLKDLTQFLAIANPRAMILKNARLHLLASRNNHLTLTATTATDPLLPSKLLVNSGNALINPTYPLGTAFLMGGAEFELISSSTSTLATAGGISTFQDCVYECRSDIVIMPKNRLPIDLEPNATNWNLLFNYASNPYGPYMTNVFSSLNANFSAQNILLA